MAATNTRRVIAAIGMVSLSLVSCTAGDNSSPVTSSTGSLAEVPPTAEPAATTTTVAVTTMIRDLFPTIDDVNEQLLDRGINIRLRDGQVVEQLVPSVCGGESEFSLGEVLDGREAKVLNGTEVGDDYLRAWITAGWTLGVTSADFDTYLQRVRTGFDATGNCTVGIAYGEKCGEPEVYSYKGIAGGLAGKFADQGDECQDDFTIPSQGVLLFNNDEETILEESSQLFTVRRFSRDQSGELVETVLAVGHYPDRNIAYFYSVEFNAANKSEYPGGYTWQDFDSIVMGTADVIGSLTVLTLELILASPQSANLVR